MEANQTLLEEQKYSSISLTSFIPSTTKNASIQVCNTVNEQQCNTVNEQVIFSSPSSSLEKAIASQQYFISSRNNFNKHFQVCNTVQEQKCETQYMEKYEEQCSNVNEQVHSLFSSLKKN